MRDVSQGCTNGCDDARAVIPLVLDQLDRTFQLVCLDRLTPKEKEYLKAMADLGPEPHRSGTSRRSGAGFDLGAHGAQPRCRERFFSLRAAMPLGLH